jgi:hypothetical protein
MTAANFSKDASCTNINMFSTHVKRDIVMHACSWLIVISSPPLKMANPSKEDDAEI